MHLNVLFSGEPINVVIEFIQNNSLDFLVIANYSFSNTFIYRINQNT